MTIIKSTKKSFEKKQVKEVKIFLRKKKRKNKNRPETDIKIPCEEQKEKSVSIIVNVMRVV